MNIFAPVIFLVEAVKELFFTKKGATLYAIAPQLPDEALVIRDVPISEDSEVSLLGYEAPLSWRNVGNDIVIQTSKILRSQMPSELAIVFRITNIGE